MIQIAGWLAFAHEDPEKSHVIFDVDFERSRCHALNVPSLAEKETDHRDAAGSRSHKNGPPDGILSIEHSARQKAISQRSVLSPKHPIQSAYQFWGTSNVAPRMRGESGKVSR